MIKLANDTISNKDVDNLIKWLKTYPRLTKGDMTIKFEDKWSKWIGRKYSVFVNSGSSANLAMAYVLLLQGKLKNKKVIVPNVSWVTTVTPFMQLGFDPILCDTDKETLGVDVEYLEELFKKHKPSILVIVHVLAFPNKMKEIMNLCEKYGVILLEDSCESMGSTYGDKMTGQFGLMSTFSMYFAHHFSVSPNTPIPYIDDQDEFKIDSVKYIYDNYKKNPENIKIICFDKKNYKTIYKSPKNILEHKFENKKIIKLTTSYNRIVDITEDHSVFSYDKNNFNVTEKKGNEISVGDYILVPSKIERYHIKKELNFIDWCRDRKDEFFVINYDEKDLKGIWFNWESKENKQKDNWRVRGVLPLEYLKTNTNELKIAKKNTPKNKYLPTKYEINEDLCKLIGYFLAEGSYGNSSLSFSFHKKELEYINDVKNTIKKEFGLENGDIIVENGHTVRIYSETLKIFFEDYLNIKSGASNKRIPSFIFHCTDSQIISFLYGYFAGDGTRNKNRISVTSVSEYLINDISYLCSMLGLNGTVDIEKYDNDKDYYILNKKVKHKMSQNRFTLNGVCFLKDGSITINKSFEYSSPHKKLTFPIGRFSKKLGKIIDYKCSEYKKVFNEDFRINEKLNIFINGDLMLLKVKKIEEISPDYDFVYDFSVEENENFIGGLQPICLHNSTIEGGLISTDDKELYNLLKSIRAHGWDRDLDEDVQIELRKENSVSEFKDLYTFYYPGFNLRSTDLQAFIGLGQLDKLDECNRIRNNNYLLYHELIKNNYWKIRPVKDNYISNFAYPIIHPNIKNIIKNLQKNGVETRPLVCGAISKQPFWKNAHGETSDMFFSEVVDKYGIYLPNNQKITEEDVRFICKIVNDSF